MKNVQRPAAGSFCGMSTAAGAFCGMSTAVTEKLEVVVFVLANK